MRHYLVITPYQIKGPLKCILTHVKIRTTPIIAGSQLSTRIVSSLWSQKKGQQDTKGEYQHFSYLLVTQLSLLKLHCHRKTIIFFTMIAPQLCKAAELLRFWGWVDEDSPKKLTFESFSAEPGTAGPEAGLGFSCDKNGKLQQDSKLWQTGTAKRAKNSIKGFTIHHFTLSQFNCLPWTCSASSGKIWLTPLWMR